jgi:hypothetical protein
MSVVLVQKPCTADTTSSPERPDPDDAADDVTFVPTIPQTVKDLSKNNWVQVYTNNPWSIYSPKVRAGIQDLNLISANCVEDKRVTAFLEELERFNDPTDRSKPSPQFVIASPSQAEEWVRTGKISDIRHAHSNQPLEVRRMMSNNPTIAVSADKHGVQLFTNKHPTDLSQSSQANLAQDLLEQVSQPSEQQPDNQCTNPKSRFDASARKIIEIGHNHAPYSIVQVDNRTRNAFLRGDCAGVSLLTEADLSAAASARTKGTRGSEMQGVGTAMSGSRTQGEKQGGARHWLRGFGSDVMKKFHWGQFLWQRGFEVVHSGQGGKWRMSVYGRGRWSRAVV